MTLWKPTLGTIFREVASLIEETVLLCNNHNSKFVSTGMQVFTHSLLRYWSLSNVRLGGVRGMPVLEATPRYMGRLKLWLDGRRFTKVLHSTCRPDYEGTICTDSAATGNLKYLGLSFRRIFRSQVAVQVVSILCTTLTSCLENPPDKTATSSYAALNRTSWL